MEASTYLAGLFLADIPIFEIHSPRINRGLSAFPAGINQHEASRGCRRRDSHLLHTRRTIRTVRWSSVLEAWLPHGILHGHGLYAQFVQSLFPPMHLVPR